MKGFEAVGPVVTTRPAHWEVAEFRRIAALVENHLGDARVPALSLSSAGGVLAPRGEGARQQPTAEYLRRYWRVEPGLLVVNPMWLIGGAIGVSQVEGAVSPDYRVYRLDDHLHPRFVHHLVRSQPYFDQYRLLVRAETTFDRRITKQDFHELPILIPPLAEQRAIANFLDSETARIDALIVKKRQLIELLDERFENWLSEAFSCTQRAGIERAGPWPWVPLRHVARVHGGLTLGKTYEQGTRSYPYLRVANVQDRRLDLHEVTTVEVPPEVAARFLLKPGDILMLEGNGNPDNLGRGTMWNGEVEQCLHQNHVHAVRVDPARLIPEYLDWLVRTQWARWTFTAASEQVSIATLSQAQILDLPIPVPPRQVQMEVVAVANRAAARSTKAVASLEAQIALVAEHRQALITAAVTGEISVPGVAA